MEEYSPLVGIGTIAGAVTLIVSVLVLVFKIGTWKGQIDSKISSLQKGLEKLTDKADTLS